MVAGLIGQGLNPVPTPNSISPNHIEVGHAEPLTLTVTGSGFIPNSVVNWNGAALTTAYVSSTQLTATIPASDFTTKGNDQITVTNPGPGGGTSSALTFEVLAANTTTVVTSSLNPSVYGQSITFTASVAGLTPGTGTPTGTVTFYDGSTALGSATLNASGNATFATQSLSSGSHTITAAYGGDGTFGTSTSTALDQVVQQDSTFTSVASSEDPSFFGESITFTATVEAVASTTGTPTGTVTFYDGSTALGSATLAAGTANFKTAKLTAGQHTITAVYKGKGNFATSTSTALDQVVQQDGTTTSVASSKDPSAFGESIRFTATVNVEEPGAGKPTGSVTFYDGSTVLGSATLSGSGRATFTTQSLSAGSHAITAVYDGDGNYASSTSTTLTQTVQGDSTTTTVASSKRSSVYGEAVTFTAKVKVVSPGKGTPTGSITFSNGATILDIASLDSTGTATFTTSSLSVGAHAIQAVYSGDGNFAPSDSKVLDQTVKQDGTKTVVVSSANPSGVGQAVTFTATVLAAAPGTGTPTGSITFYDGTTILGTGTLSGGTASFTTASLSKGKHKIKAVYSGDLDFKSSTSSVLRQVVNSTSGIVTVGADAGVPAGLSGEPVQAVPEAPVSRQSPMTTAVIDAAIGGLNPSYPPGLVPLDMNASGNTTVASLDQVLASWSQGRKPGSGRSPA